MRRFFTDISKVFNYLSRFDRRNLEFLGQSPLKKGVLANNFKKKDIFYRFFEEINAKFNKFWKTEVARESNCPIRFQLLLTLLSHDLLGAKFYACGFIIDSVQLMHQYLYKHKQKTKINSIYSSLKKSFFRHLHLFMWFIFI